MPKPSGIISTKLTHSLRLQVGLRLGPLVVPEHEVEQRLEREEERQQRPADEQADADRHVGVDVALLVLVETRRDELPDEVEDERAREDQPRDERRLQPDRKRLHHAVADDAQPRVLLDRLEQSQFDQFIAIDAVVALRDVGVIARRQLCGLGGSVLQGAGLAAMRAQLRILLFKQPTEFLRLDEILA